MAHRAYKFRLNPTATQAKALGSQLETLRQVYNAALAYWRDLYEAEKRSPKSNELYSVFSTLRNLQIEDRKAGGAGPHWLANVSAVAMRDTCKRVAKAFENFFRRVKQKATKVGYPRFKGYGRLSSIPFENYASGCVLRDAAGKSLAADVPLARKGYRLDVFGVGRIKTIAHRPVVGVIKTACVERDVDGKWYVVLVARSEEPAPPESTLPPVGIDVGLEHFLTTSDGAHVANPKHLRGNLKKLRRLQRSASRKTEAAKEAKAKFRDRKNLQKQFHKVAKLHVRVRNLRKEGHHQASNLLVRKYGTVCVEKLNVRGMLRNDKLARAISDAAWGGFLIVLKHKAAKAGVRFVEVDARGTSQTCPQCGAVAKKKLSQRRHRCPCGYETQRDVAAAQVILARGTASNTAGSVVVQHNPGGMPGGKPSGGRGAGRIPKRSQKSPPVAPPRAAPQKRAAKPSAAAARSRNGQKPLPGMEDV
jgi:putative transposase